MKLSILLKLSTLTLLVATCSTVYAQGNEHNNVQPSKVNTLTNEVTKPTINETPTAKEDKIITNSIQSHIKKSKVLSDLKVHVETHQGDVKLSGNVDSNSQVDMLVELAQSIVGVKDVDSELKVKKGEQPFTDMLITAKIKGLFIREDVFGTKDIASINLSVETKDGIVYLTGTIDNKEQINNAIKIAESVKGVKKVEYKVNEVKMIPSSKKDDHMQEKT